MLLSLLKVLFTNAGLVMQVVKLVEALFPDSPGKEKLDHAVNLIGGLIAAEPAAAPHIDAVRAAAVPLVNLAVAVANASGIFSKPVQSPLELEVPAVDAQASAARMPWPSAPAL